MVVPDLKVDSYALLTRPPLCPKTSFDLHVLSIPPAFILSQDQTLHFGSFFLALATVFTTTVKLFFSDAGCLLFSGFQTIIFSRFGALFGVASLGFAVRHLFNISNLFGFVNYFFYLFEKKFFISLKPAHSDGFSPQWVRNC